MDERFDTLNRKLDGLSARVSEVSEHMAIFMRTLARQQEAQNRIIDTLDRIERKLDMRQA